MKVGKDNLAIDFLPDRAKSYVVNIFRYLKQNYKDKIISMMVFGSSLTGELCETSDCDLICVMDDKTSRKEIKTIRKKAKEIAIKYGFFNRPNGFIERVLHIMDSSTGMFISLFVCKKNDFINLRFSRMFNVNALVAWLLAPKNLVIGTVLNRSKHIYGENLLETVKKPKRFFIQLIKNMVLNLLVSLVSFIIYPFSPKATKYELESLKWSMLSSYYYINGTRPSMNKICYYFISKGISKKYIANFKKLRDGFHQDVMFGLRTPFEIIRIHILGLKNPGYP
ncbi:MAG: nucleotidyltransferase domain-containing protein [Candidatus Helarchaeota archaeon]